MLDWKDRRYLILQAPPVRELSYFEALIHWRDNGGAEALHHFLLNYDTKGYSPHGHAPNTRAKGDMTEESKRDTEVCGCETS